MLDLQHDGSEGDSSVGVAEDLNEGDYHYIQICHGAGRLTHRFRDAAMARVDARNAREVAQRSREAGNGEDFLDHYLQSLLNRDQASSMAN